MVKYYYSKYSAVESLYPLYTAQSVIRFNPDGSGNRRIDSELIKLGMNINLDHPMHKTSISVVESQRRLWIERDYNGLTLGYHLQYLLETYGPGEHYYFEVGYDPKFYSIYPTTDYECTLYEWKVGSSYSRGSLIQSDIQAENNTYPTDGRHTDGYWYVRGEQINVAPTQPGAFTQPSGSLEIGDPKVFSVGASSDENGNLSKYIWEVSVNNAAYSKAGETTAPNFTYTIPTATSLKMRVKAVDSGGLESSYRESSQYTVTKPKYYWSKYNADPVYEYALEEYNPSPKEIALSKQSGTEFADMINQLADVYTDRNTYGSFDKINYPYSQQINYKLYAFNSKATATKDGVILGGGKDYYLATSSYNLDDFNAGNTIYGQVAHAYIGQFTKGQMVVFKPVFASNGTDHHRVRVAFIRSKENLQSYSKGTLVQTNIQADYDSYANDARNSDGYWYVRGSRVNQSIAPPSPFTAPVSGKKFKPGETANITFGASNAANLSLYEVDFRYNSTGTWSQLAYNNTLTRSLTITTDKALKTLEFRVRAKNTSNVYSDYVYSEPFAIEHNVAPTVSLSSPTENVTLYENDILNIAGTAYDADADQSVTVYYQINSEQRKVLATNLSQTQIPLSKQLKFTGGKLYDGDTAITGNLADGVAHKLKVWAEDSEKASSAIVEKSFYVVPNRAPLLSVDAVVPSGVVDNDKFKISGAATDPDDNSTVKVTRRINSGNAIEIYSGTGGEWEFEIALAQLHVGENTIVVEVVDNYGAKTSKTIKLNKNAVSTPILQSVARYKIEPPKGSARGVLLWVQRDEELDLTVELSMTLKGEQEQYTLLKLDPKNILPVVEGIVEDEYYHETVEPKDNIILKLTTTRANNNIDHKIYLIMGVVE
ncbi:hypothetical protein [Lysinibacillus sp. NPDC096212]|uniref:hypothetical protein n=1 Tax=Lysinibacillus sp. NPDC096212 TaxID=3364135 RepID=UPI0038301BD5